LKNILFKIEYLGTHYSGWQIQEAGIKTVEESIERVLQQVCRQEIDVKACSRTDSGVHARGQVAHFYAPKSLSLKKIFFSLNSLLPDDITIRDMVEVPMEFSARQASQGKSYHYRISNSPVPKALSRDQFWWVRYCLDVDLMRQAAQDLIGIHDFSAFRGKYCQARSPIKHLVKIEITEIQDGVHKEVRMHFEGSGFLRNMIRIMAGTLVDIARGQLPPDRIQEVLKSGKRAHAGITAPPHGLILDQVFYNPDPFLTRNMETWDQNNGNAVLRHKLIHNNIVPGVAN